MHQRPITILDLRDTHDIGGPGKTILETYRALDASRFKMHLGVFLTRHEDGDTPFSRAAAALGMPVHIIRGYNQYDPTLAWRLAALVRSLKVDILHPHEVKSDVLSLLAAPLCRVPVVTTLHGWIGNSPKQRFLNGLDKRIVGRFDAVLAVSNRTADAVRPHVPAGRLHVLYNGIVLANYRRTGRTGHVASLIGRPPRGVVLTTIGRLSREKGQLDFLEAVRQVVDDGIPVTAVLVGEGPDRPVIEARIRELALAETVFLVGHQDQPARVLEEADLMVLPSHTEGLPNVVLEALSMEVPVLATHVGGTPELITDGDTGRLVEPHAPQALAAAIGEFHRNRDGWRAMAQRGRSTVEAEFDFAIRTQRLEALYSALAGKTA